MIGRCCCGQSPCEISDCTSVNADCCSVGLQPFTLSVYAEMRATTCSTYAVGFHQCDAPNCSSWGTVPCGGCSPCDPDGTAPGANGRTCPCKDSTCQKPAGRQIPVQTCEKGKAGILDECRYAHNDFWYVTFDPLGNPPCDVPVDPPCPWLGSVSCGFHLVHVPAGYGVVQCREVTGSEKMTVDTMSPCDSSGSIALPTPMCDTPTIYGWPIDCEFAPPLPEGCQCVCECNVGVFPAMELRDEVNEGCNSTYAFARLMFAVPCGNTTGTILCGHGCDTCAASYIGVYVQMSSVFKAVGVVGDPFLGEASPPYDDLCEGLGISNNVPPGSECDAGSEFNSSLCNDKCCECVRGWYVVMRKYREASDGNLCTMAKGRYEIVGTTLCGDGVPHWACGTFGSGGEVPCIDGLSACSSPAAWDDYFSKLGLKLEVEIT